jgi:hypothetical protein
MSWTIGWISSWAGDDWVFAGIAAAGAAVLAAGAWLAVRMTAYRNASVSNAAADEAFSMARYQPMTRLLDRKDLEFLATQPGYRPEIGARLRRARKKIFRMYLRELAGDFRRLHAHARQIAAQSDAQHADLVGLLMRQQLTFWRAMAGVELRMLAGWTGMDAIDVRGLVESVETMRVDLARAAASAV